MAISSSTHREWALLGARARLEAIDAERTAILKAFPQLRRAGAASGSLRPQRHISATARKAMSEGMRRYWARRKAQAKAPK